VNGKPLYYYIDKDNLGTDNFTNAGQIILANCSGSLIFNLTISDCSTGISLYYSSHNNVSGNFINNNSDIGIYLSDSNYNNITGNTINNNSYTGIILLDSNYNNIAGNTANNNTDGIYLQSSQSNAVSNNEACNNTESGIYISDNYWMYEENSIKENKVEYNYYGIYLSNTRFELIKENNVNNNYYGVYLDSSSRENNVSENTIGFNIYGIRLNWDCDSNIITVNTIHNNDYGIRLYYSDSNTIKQNTISNNMYGIHIYSSKCNTISDNDFSGNTVDIQGTQDECDPVPIGVVVAIVLPIVIIALCIVGGIVWQRNTTNKKRLPKDEVARYNVLQERKRYETPIRKTTVETKPLAANVSRCPYCGTPMNDDWVFCKKCGSKSEKKMWKM